MSLRGVIVALGSLLALAGVAGLAADVTYSPVALILGFAVVVFASPAGDGHGIGWGGSGETGGGGGDGGGC